MTAAAEAAEARAVGREAVERAPRRPAAAAVEVVARARARAQEARAEARVA